MTDSARARWWTLGILIALGLPKIWLSLVVPPMGGDGGYYANVASHVAAGDGLVSDLSLMHKGYGYFPHPTAVYPVWPWLLGMAARVWSLNAAGTWIPTASYFLAVLGIGAWANRLFPGRLHPALPGLRPGHVAMLVLGLDREFFWFSSLPYTEGPSYALLTWALWRAHGLLRRPGLLAGIELGVYGSVLLLIRSQMLLFQLALWATLGLALLAQRPRRGALLRALVGTTAAFAAVLTPWVVHLREISATAPMVALLRFDQARPNDLLSPLKVMVAPPSRMDWLFDRLGGLLVAFPLAHKYAYATHAWLLPYAMLAAAGSLLGRALCWPRAAARQAAAWLKDPDHLGMLFQIVFALAGVASLHVLHKKMWDPWNFHLRHALTASFAIVLSLVYLVRRSPNMARLAAALILASTFMGAMALPGLVQRAEKEAATPFLPHLAKWLSTRAQADGPLRVASTVVQGMWRVIPDATIGYHRIYKKQTTLADLHAMVHTLGVDYVIVCRGRPPRFTRKARFHREFRRVTVQDGCKVYAPRAPGQRATSPRGTSPIRRSVSAPARPGV